MGGGPNPRKEEIRHPNKKEKTVLKCFLPCSWSPWDKKVASGKNRDKQQTRRSASLEKLGPWTNPYLDEELIAGEVRHPLVIALNVAIHF